MTNTIQLPKGHEWLNCKFAPISASETQFECSRCGATFFHDMIDNSQYFEDGNGSCDETASEL